MLARGRAAHSLRSRIQSESAESRKADPHALESALAAYSLSDYGLLERINSGTCDDQAVSAGQAYEPGCCRACTEARLADQDLRIEIVAIAAI
jgi:hypothetical protein